MWESKLNEERKRGNAQQIKRLYECAMSNTQPPDGEQHKSMEWLHFFGRYRDNKYYNKQHLFFDSLDKKKLTTTTIRTTNVQFHI